MRPPMNTPAYRPLTYIYQPGAAAGPTLLLLPGTGGDERDLLPVAPRLAPGLGVLSVRGNVLEGGMPRFFRRLGPGVFDEEDVIFRTHELARFLGEVSAAEGFDGQRLVAVGYSNGANIAGGLLLLYPGLLAGAVLWRPMQPLRDAEPGGPDLSNAPVLFMPGTHDPTVSPAATVQYAALLIRRGFRLTRRDVPAGHNLTPADVDAAATWFGQHFDPAPAGA